MQGIHTLVRRRSWLLAAAALAAICALVAIALAPAQAQTTTIPADAALTISLANDSDNVVPADGTTQTVNIGLTYTVSAGNQNANPTRPWPTTPTAQAAATPLWPDGDDVAFDVYGLTLRVSGSLEWDANGRSSLSAAEGLATGNTGYGLLASTSNTDAAIKIVTTAPGTGDGTNNNQVLCTPRTIDGTTTYVCSFNSTDITTANVLTSTGLRDISTTDAPLIESDTSITIPEGVSGDFTISAVAKLKAAGEDDAATDRTIRGSLKVTVGTVDEVASATLGLAPNLGDPTDSGDDGSWPSTLDGGSTTRLRLQVLNANDRGAAAGSVASILVTTDAAKVVGRNITHNSDPAGNKCVGSSTASLACQIPVQASGTAPNRDIPNFNASTSANILIDVVGPGAGKSAVANVKATLLSAAGANITTETVTITFSGKLDKLTISEPTSGLLNTVTADDNRDRLILSVSGVDSSGNNTPPSGGQGTPLIKDSSGRTVAAGSITTDWPRLKTGETTPGTNCANCARDAAGNIQVQINVTAEAANKLAAGDYTIQLRADGKSDTQTFTVSGDVDTVTVSEPEGTLAVNERISVTATVNDADGNAVPDGTTITFTAAQAGTAPVLVKVASDTRTTGGTANATYLVVGTGTGWVNATAGGKSGIQLITVAAAEVAPADPADNLSTTVPGFSSWTGSATGTASELLSSLSGISQILLWQNGWLRYGVADGRVIPGSIDFEIRRGAILWLSR